MKNPYLLILFITLVPGIVLGQQTDPTKEELKKKYENSDLFKETEKKMQSGESYPDSIVLPPLHFINTNVKITKAEFEFKSISFDIDVQTAVPNDYKLYISPFTGTINKMLFYCGIQTNSDGKPVTGGDNTQIGRGAIFSRWMERDKAALKTRGYYASADSEGDFISVRNKFKWDKGIYRIRLFKAGYIKGKPIPAGTADKDLFFSWGDYEHTWVTLEVGDVKSHQKQIIGSLAFPGKKLMFSNNIGIFLEQYGAIINFSSKPLPINFPMINYKKLPVVKVAVSNLMINGKKIKPLSVITGYNLTHNTEQSKIAMPIPLLSKAAYDAATGTIQYEVGSFQSWITPKE